jgi:hypothetical protein
MKKGRMTKNGLVLGVSIIVALGFIAVKATEHDMSKPGGMIKAGDMSKPAKVCTMKDMQECTMKCMANCEKNMKDIPAAIASLDNAVKAIDAGNTAEAKMEIEKANKMLKDMLIAQKKCMEKMPTVNDACPITGKKIDMMNTPEKLTILYKGKKVGFCCPACPAEWEKLTDAEKDAKLEPRMFKAPEAQDMQVK